MEEVRNWLRGQGLEQYASKFDEFGWDSLDILQDMEPDDIKDCIDKPGHRKKFEKGLKTNPPAPDSPAEKGNPSRTEDTKRDEKNVKANQHYEVQLGQLITEITKDTAGNETPEQEGACKLHEPDRIVDKYKFDKLDNTVDNADIGSALVPYRDPDWTASGSSASVDSQKDGSTGESLCTVKCGAARTVVVRGAQNQTIEIPPDVKPQESIKRDVSRASDGRITPEEDQVRHSEQDVVNHITDTEPPDFSTDEDVTTIVGPDGLVEQHHLVKGAAANMPITRATIVTDSKNVTIAKKAEVYHVHQNVEEKPIDNFKDQTSIVIQSYRNKDHLYVETSAFQDLKEIVDARYWATITGRSGDGKTAMAAHLLLQYKDKGYEPVIVFNPQDWKVLVEGIKGKRQYVMIDDMFGGSSVDERKVNEWLAMIDFMQRVVKERAGQLIVVSTNRQYIFMDIKSKLEKFAYFQDTSMLDLTARKHDLSFAEKKQIWLKYAEEYRIPADSVSDDIFLPENPFTLESPHGFPHCVEMYCSNTFLRKEGEDFFKNPMQFICQEISNFMENDKLKYCILLYILFENNELLDITKLETDLFSSRQQSINKIIKTAGLAAPPAYSELQKALKSLLMTYIAEYGNGMYSFAHDSIEENVAHVYIKNNPLSSIENLDLSYIIAYTRCFGYKSESLKPVYIFPSHYTGQLVERMVKEILKGHALIVTHYDAWEDQSFIDKWVDYLLCTLQVRNAETTTKATFKDIMFTENQDKRNTRKEPNIIEALICNKREKALISMFAQEEIFKEFSDDMATKWLMLACESGLNKQCILQLIRAGANVHTVWTETELTKDTHIYMIPGYYEVSELTCITLYSPLLLAVLRSNEEVASLLLEQKASIFLSGKADILIVAFVLGKTNFIRLIFQFISKWIHSSPLLKYSVIPSDKMQISEVLGSLCNGRIIIKQFGVNSVCTPVHLVGDIELLKELLTRGAQLNTDVLFPRKRIPHFLFRLISYTDILLLRDMIRYGMMIKGEWGGLSCLHCFVLACFHYRIQKSLMLQIEFPTEQDKMDEVCQFVTEFISSSACVCLINEKDKQGNTALHHVIEQWNKTTECGTRIKDALFKSLLSNNADVNLSNGEGATVVMKALESCPNVKNLQDLVNLRKPKLVDNSGRGYLHYLACTELPENCVQELCSCLLESGEDINLQDYHGNPPIFYTTIVNIQVFTNAGANLDITNNSGENIAMFFLRNGKIKMTKNLISVNKAFIHFTDKGGRNVMHYLMMPKEQEIANRAYKYLPPPGSKRSITSAEYKEAFDFLMSVECDSKLSDNNGVTPPMLAVENNNFDIEFLKYIIRKCADTESVDCMNMSVLHHCLIGSLSENKLIETFRYLKSHAENVALISRNVLHFAITQTVCPVEVIVECLNCDQDDYSKDVNAITTDILASNRSTECKINCLRSILAEFDLRMIDLFKDDFLTVPQECDILSYSVKNNEISIKDLALSKEHLLEIIDCISTKQTVVNFLKQLVQLPNGKTFLSDMQVWNILCRHNDVQALNFIASVGTKTDSIDADGNSLLHLVIKHLHNDNESVAIIKQLLGDNAVLQLQNNYLMTPLHIACLQSLIKPQSVHVLVTGMDNVDMVDCCGMTALHYICSNININSAVMSSDEFDTQVYVAFCLILKGANVDHQNFEGQSSLMLAIKNNPLNSDLIDLLIENTNNVNASDTSGNSALHHLVRSSVEDEMKTSLLQTLIDKGGDTDLENKDGQTAVSIMQSLFNLGGVGLHIYAILTKTESEWNLNDTFYILSKHLSSMRSESSDYIQLFNEIIIQRQLDMNIRSPTDSKTLLMIASENVLPNIVKILLSRKADPNMTDMVGYSCFIKLLTSSVLLHLSVLQTCLLGASVDALNFWNYGVKTKDLLYQRVVASEKSLTDFEYKIADREEASCRTVLEYKARALDVLEALLLHGTDPNKTDITGKTALHHYVESPVSDIFICPAIKQLLQHGANVNARDHDGVTPLMLCSHFEGRKARRMNILLNSDANISDTDNFGRDAVEYGTMAFGKMFLLNQ